MNTRNYNDVYKNLSWYKQLILEFIFSLLKIVMLLVAMLYIIVIIIDTSINTIVKKIQFNLIYYLCFKGKNINNEIKIKIEHIIRTYDII